VTAAQSLCDANMTAIVVRGQGGCAYPQGALGIFPIVFASLKALWCKNGKGRIASAA